MYYSINRWSNYIINYYVSGEVSSVERDSYVRGNNISVEATHRYTYG